MTLQRQKDLLYIKAWIRTTLQNGDRVAVIYWFDIADKYRFLDCIDL